MEKKTNKAGFTEIVFNIIAFKQKLKDLICNLPDNPNITRISETKAFTISMSTMVASGSLIMSPFYYDFKAQYKAISETVDRVEVMNIYSTMERIIKEGKIKVQNHSETLHPDVVKQLKNIFENS